jgi:hypothetical protein
LTLLVYTTLFLFTQQSFPFEVGKTLIRKARLVVHNSLEETLDVYPDFKKARTALLNFQKSVEEKKNDVIDTKLALEEALKEIASIESNARKIQKGLMLMGVVGSAAIGGSLEGFPGLIAGLASGMISTDIVAKPLSDKISKIGKPSHIVAVCDFMRAR